MLRIKRISISTRRNLHSIVTRASRMSFNFQVLFAMDIVQRGISLL